MNTKVKHFIDFVKEECRNEGVKCILKNVSYLKLSPSIRASGYFDEAEPALVCSMNRPDAIEILVHEYGHLTQWREQIPLWKAIETSMPILDDWLEGKDVPNIRKHIAKCRDLELDNEKRAVRLIKKFDLPIDIENYVRKANAYVHFYNYMMLSRRWCTPQNSPYKNKAIIKIMSPKFNMKYDKLPKYIEDKFREENF